MSSLVFRSRAFTLTEALIAVTVAGVVAVTLTPIVAKAKSGEGALIDAARVGGAHAQYAADYDPQDAGYADEGLKGVHPTVQNVSYPPTNAMKYHGGPIVTGELGVYYIWYGNWTGNTAVTILTDFANNLGGSPYWNINTTYSTPAGGRILNKVALRGTTTDNYSRGTSLSDGAIRGVVSDAITQGRLPMDTKAVYFVLTSADVTASSGFCTAYCGWHTHATISGSDIKYSFVGNPDRCPSACEIQTTSPNNNAGADGMASVIAHEAEETATDPDLNAWYTNNGAENADLCAWTFGTTFTASNGSQYNMTMGGRQWMIQQNWPYSTGALGCTTHYP